LPFLTAFTTVLDVNVIGAINLAWIYAFAQFAMTWILMHLYVSRANRWGYRQGADDVFSKLERDATIFEPGGDSNFEILQMVASQGIAYAP
jgi:hypothetical protein